MGVAHHRVTQRTETEDPLVGHSLEPRRTVTMSHTSTLVRTTAGTLDSGLARAGVGAG